MAFGDPPIATDITDDEAGDDDDDKSPALPAVGPPRRWPPPEKGVKGVEGARAGWAEESPDGPALSPSSTGVAPAELLFVDPEVPWVAGGTSAVAEAVLGRDAGAVEAPEAVEAAGVGVTSTGLSGLAVRTGAFNAVVLA